MQIFKTVKAMQQHADEQRCAGKKLALVPTMGALHHGHLALATRASEIADHVTVSIFVNPTQFGPSEDFDAYPRNMEADLAKLEKNGGVDAVFMPDVNTMYPRSQEAHKAWVNVNDLDQHLCGRFRDGHFQGVTTVVTKLFNACKPHIGVFGLKDAQQFLILRRMVEDLNMDITLEGVPTVREEDGLASSSRNVYLTADQREQAPRLYEALQMAKKAIEEGERDIETIRTLVVSHITKLTEGTIQYIEIVDTVDIQPAGIVPESGEVVIALAVYFGDTRLIDNVFVSSGMS